MGYEEVQDLGTDNVIALGGFNKKTKKDNPLSIEGYYLGSREVPSKLAKTGVAKIHVFKTPKGNVGVWGKTDIDIKLGGVKPGTMTLVKFDKMQATKTGEMYKYKVSVDKSNTIEVAGSESFSSEEDTPYSGGNQTPEEEETVEEDDEDEDALQAQALAQAERQAKVAALLRNNGKGKAAK